MSEILITDQPTIEQYSASEGDTTFPFHFPIYEDQDLKVNYQPIGTVVDDTGTLLTLNTDYIISGIGNETGGTVVLKFHAAAGAIVTVRRDRLFARSSNLGQGGEFSTDDLNRDFNSQLMLAQQLKTKNNMRQLSYQESEVIPTGDEKLPKLGPKQIWRKPPSGIGIEALDYDPQESIDAALLRAELKSNGVGQGASMVGTEGSGNVQQVVDNFLDFKSDLKDTAHAKGASLVGVEGGTNVQDFIDSYTSALVLPNIISGLIVNQNATDPLHDIDISAGVCSSSDASVYMKNTGIFTKQIDAVWALGSGNGGRASSVLLTTNTWYHVFGITKPDGTWDAGFDTSIIAANLLADATGFTKIQRLGSVYYTTITAVDQIQPFSMKEDGTVKWKTPQGYGSNIPSAARGLFSLSVPPDVVNIATVGISIGGVHWGVICATDPACDDTTAWAQFVIGSLANQNDGSQVFEEHTNTNRQIGLRRIGLGVDGAYGITTYSWKERRI